MQRRQVTQAVIKGVGRLLAQGVDHSIIAARLGITPYVVGVVANDKCGKGRSPRPNRSRYRSDQANSCVGSATIRMIQRLLAAHWLDFGQIAREAGVCQTIVEEVAAGRRPAITTERPFTFEDLGERFVEETIRCSVCGATLNIVPCRACRTRRESCGDPKISSSSVAL
jgi:hypothetical protein